MLDAYAQIAQLPLLNLIDLLKLLSPDGELVILLSLLLKLLLEFEYFRFELVDLLFLGLKFLPDLSGAEAKHVFGLLETSNLMCLLFNDLVFLLYHSILALDFLLQQPNPILIGSHLLHEILGLLTLELNFSVCLLQVFLEVVHLNVDLLILFL